MSKHPVNLAIRFALEVAAIITVGVWGFRSSDEWYGYLLALLLPLLFVVLWGAFAVDLDFQKLGWIFSTVVLIHYATSYDRIAWLLKQK